MPHVKSSPGSSSMPAGSSCGDSKLVAGFAKMQGEDFEYYMQTYSIMLGRNSKKSTVDVDLPSLGGGMNISCQHARIFYDFQHRRFALDVIGRNGCLVDGVLHLPGNPPVKLDSQDLLQIGDKKFYFLLPARSIFASLAAARHAPVVPLQIPPPSFLRLGNPRLSDSHDRSSKGNYGRDIDDIGKGVRKGRMKGKLKRTKKPSADLDIYGGQQINVDAIETLGEEITLIGDKDVDNQHILKIEEKEVVSSVMTVLSDLCGPGKWTTMEKLHRKLVDQFGNVWHHRRVRNYLTAEEWPEMKDKGRPWYGLLVLLRNYPEHFVVLLSATEASEFVSLVSLLSKNEEARLQSNVPSVSYRASP